MNGSFDFCFITDDGYVKPTLVAMRSLVENGIGDDVSAVIHVVAADLSDENVELFLRCAANNAEIDVVRASATELAALHKTAGDMCVATPAALLKFSLGELLPGVDRVLYLDGDILVRKPLRPVFDVELGENVLAAAPDTGALYCRRPIHDEVKRYFNSGVMLLNLKKMREEGCARKLIAAKATSRDHALMDQDVFNRVFDGRWLPLPPRCNFLLLNLLRAQAFGLWTMADFNAAFATAYADLAALDDDALVVHFSSREKPWKFRDVPYAASWFETLSRTPLAGMELERGLLTEDWPVRLPLDLAGRAQWWRADACRKIETVGILCRSLGKGGLERAMSVDIPMFVRMGLKVVVFTDLPVSADDYDIPCEYRRVRLPVADSDTVAHGAALRSAMAEAGVDLLLHNDAYIPPRLAADVRAALTLDIPVAIYWHSVFTHFLLRPGRQFETKALFDACRGACIVFTHTKTDEAFFRMYGIPAVKNPLSSPDMMRGFVRNSWPHRLLWMGRMTEIKRPLDALEIFSRVRERVADCELVMLGDGDTMVVDAVRRWLHRHPDCARGVHLEGYRKDVRPYLESCGVGLVTSRFEGFCYSLVEMKMASMPVVSYAMPYLDTLKDESGALCVPQGNVDAAALRIVELFGNDSECARHGRLARISYEEIASSHAEDRYRELIDSLENGGEINLGTIGTASARLAIETMVDHVQCALEIMERETSAIWMRDRSYRLGRIMTWPYRKLKSAFLKTIHRMAR